jgi:GMP synthase (glutamine-hydrolysing)
MRLHYLQHVTIEGLVEIEGWARGRGFAISATRLHEGERLPEVSSFDWLVVMGGPMNIYEDDLYPWLRAEKRFIAEAIEAGCVVVGVCLGAQLIADVLGGRVTRNAHTEIGWFPLTLTAEGMASPLFAGLPESIAAFHWHGDTFAIPPGATLLASSEGCRNQVFQYGDRVLGLQCHLEENEESIEYLLTGFEHEMTPGPYVQSAEAIRGGCGALAPMRTHLRHVLDQLYRVAGGGGTS